MLRFVVKCNKRVEKSLNEGDLISDINKSLFLPECSKDEHLCDVMAHQTVTGLTSQTQRIRI